MFEGYRIVALVPAGRRAMLTATLTHLRQSALFDEIRLLVNTTDPEDLAYINGLPASDFTLQHLPQGVQPEGAKTINLMYPEATDAQTIYVKVDDDMVWMEPDAISKLLSARVNYASAFLVSPMVINNSHCTHHLQSHRKVDMIRGYIGARAAGYAWKEGVVAERLHNLLLSHIKSGTIAEMYTPDFCIAHTRYSINCVAFFGRDMARLGGEIGDIHRFKPDDEEFLTVIAPNILGTYNVVIGDTLAAHFAFGPQAEHMIETDVLAQYQAIAAEISQTR